MRTLPLALTVAAVIGCGSAAKAATLLSEDFEAENAANNGVSVLNYARFGQFTVSGGSVDLVKNGDFNIGCKNGSAVCVDLDGSTRDPGRMSSAPFVLAAGLNMTLSFAMSGNQRGGADDTVRFGFLHDGNELAISATVGPNDPFEAFYVSLFDIAAGSYSIFFENTGGDSDNRGAILDDVAWTVSGAVNVVPLPASAVLLLAGMGALVVVGQRRRG